MSFVDNENPEIAFNPFQPNFEILASSIFSIKDKIRKLKKFRLYPRGTIEEKTFPKYFGAVIDQTLNFQQKKIYI